MFGTLAARGRMRFCRFGDGRLGLVEGSSVKDVTAALEVLPAYRYPFPTHDLFIANLDKVMERARAIAPHSPTMAAGDLEWLGPGGGRGGVGGGGVGCGGRGGGVGGG